MIESMKLEKVGRQVQQAVKKAIGMLGVIAKVLEFRRMGLI